MSDDILYEEQGPIAVITMARDEKLNAISTTMSVRLREVFTRLSSNERLRAAVLAAQGRYFCAGADIKEYAGHTYEQFVEYQEGNRALYDLIERNNKPVIAAVQGPAMGGGFELVLACDAVFASEESRFSLPEVNLGLLPGGGGTQKLTRLLGRLRVKEIIMTGRTISSREAATVGLVNNVVPAHQVLPVALEYARLISTKPALAIKLAKRLVNGGTDASLGTALDYEQAVLAGLFTTEDGREGIQAFVQKRAPSFRGA